MNNQQKFDVRPYGLAMLSEEHWDDAKEIFVQMLFDARGEGINGN